VGRCLKFGIRAEALEKSMAMLRVRVSLESAERVREALESLAGRFDAARVERLPASDPNDVTFLITVPGLPLDFLEAQWSEEATRLGS
jgi:hypothetical protein